MRRGSDVTSPTPPIALARFPMTVRCRAARRLPGTRMASHLFRVQSRGSGWTSAMAPAPFRLLGNRRGREVLSRVSSSKRFSRRPPSRLDRQRTPSPRDRGLALGVRRDVEILMPETLGELGLASVGMSPTNSSKTANSCSCSRTTCFLPPRPRRGRQSRNSR